MRALLLLAFFSIVVAIPVQDNLLAMQHNEEIARRGRGGDHHYRDRDNLWVHPRSYRSEYRSRDYYRPRYMNRYWYGHYPYYRYYGPNNEFYFGDPDSGFSIRFGF